MNKRIRTAGVIGAGVMGAAIAAHMANVGIEVILLDIVPSELTEDDKKKGYTNESRKFRNKFAKKGIDTALKSKPASFYVPENGKRISIGNMEDDIGLLSEVDWIIEAVVERLDIKKSVFEKIEAVMSPETIVTSNTSGILAQALCEGRSEDFRKHFAITHFFNPPRYMKLIEIVPGPDTLHAQFCRKPNRRLQCAACHPDYVGAWFDHRSRRQTNRACHRPSQECHLQNGRLGRSGHSRSRSRQCPQWSAHR
jgi:3-hydroxyacyl-CoA dehydrogenase